ncbi:MAG TPA: glycosyltransferase family 39 protein, partial [Bryobacteraceae bacterium]|nr:glycosyltransferase family 39 protein [Bryobacteraceae bacterium]
MMETPYRASLTEIVDSTLPAFPEARPAARKAPAFNHPVIRTCVLLALTVAFLFPITQILCPPFGDEGTLLYGAQRVSEGAVPGRDFVEMIGPGSFYWLGLFFKLFGAGWQVSRLYLLFTGVATTGLLYAIARQVCHESEAVLLWLFVLVMGIPLWPVVSHHWDSNLFAILAFWCYLKLEKTDHPGWAAAAGSLAGITTCFMQQKGFLLLLAFAASAVVRRLWPRVDSPSPIPPEMRSPPASKRVGWSALWLLAGSYAAVGIVVVGAFWQAGALRDLLYANLVWPLSGYNDINLVTYAEGLKPTAMGPSLQIFGPKWAAAELVCKGLSVIPFMVIAILPLLSVMRLAEALFAHSKRLVWSPWLAVMLAGAGLWLSEIHRKDMFHLAVGSPLLLVALLGNKRSISQNGMRTALTGALAVALVAFGSLNFTAYVGGAHPVETRRGTVMTGVDDAALRFLSTAIKEREFVFIYPYCPIYYYLADIRNPTRYSVLLYGYNTPAQFDEVIRNLEEKRVRYVLDAAGYGDDPRRWFPAYR